MLKVLMELDHHILNKNTMDFMEKVYRSENYEVLDILFLDSNYRFAIDFNVFRIFARSKSFELLEYLLSKDLIQKIQMVVAQYPSRKDPSLIFSPSSIEVVDTFMQYYLSRLLIDSSYTHQVEKEMSIIKFLGCLRFYDQPVSDMGETNKRKWIATVFEWYVSLSVLSNMNRAIYEVVGILCFDTSSKMLAIEHALSQNNRTLLEKLLGRYVCCRNLTEEQYFEGISKATLDYQNRLLEVVKSDSKLPLPRLKILLRIYTYSLTLPDKISETIITL